MYCDYLKWYVIDFEEIIIGSSGWITVTSTGVFHNAAVTGGVGEECVVRDLSQSWTRATFYTLLSKVYEKNDLHGPNCRA